MDDPLALLDQLDLLLIADALDMIDPDDPHACDRAWTLANAFRRAAARLEQPCGGPARGAAGAQGAG